MSDWEDEDAIQAIPVQVPGQWDDEDQEEEVVEPIQQKVEPIERKGEQKVVSKKKNLKKKIQEKSVPVSQEETAEEKKKRLLNEQLEADLENAQDLFSGMAVKGGTNAFEHLNPSTAKEFDELKDIIIKKFSGFQGQLYSNFIENLIREISIDLDLDDSKRLVSTLNAMINEKQKSIKDAKKKKSSKKGITVIKGLDTTNYDDVYDDFDDFM